MRTADIRSLKPALSGELGQSGTLGNALRSRYNMVRP